ncbi:pyrroline-5-carboxylate reductase [Pseudomarimonas salicorniae]|uniref:Pyrroline-5-carboxylate reductase n=1 Tax=Pseudomarimonas salicorniae TaxID=2933270 RepID=A0ABT0GIJ3_9GAMM|nr:pyrroline-5-carboxylate reductase [Lysobacter sp. CAU 1642]MCK7594370.1 pyrroline-5-carboxylate reductase [Lysobacter sp. CAU 1642]
MSEAASALPRDIRIAFIGGGNMARALIGGLCRRGAEPGRIRVAEPQAALREGLKADFGVVATASGTEAVADADVVLLAVKPQVMREALGDLAASLPDGALLVSIAAGLTSSQIDRWAGGGRRVVRAMPNTPALIGQGATGLFASAACDEADRDRAEALLGAVGACAWVEEESQMDAVTALSGSGPAYLFLLAEAMQAAGEREGLPADVARRLARQTVAGAAAMLVADETEAGEQRRRVTSPNGTTQAAVESLQADGFEALVGRAIAAARRRGAELSAAAEG